jgi:autotransporter-associated beta strand protein
MNTKPFVVILFLLVLSVSLEAATYYSINSSNLSVTTNWKTGTDGSGTSPANFTNTADIFIVQTGHSCTLGSDVTFAGAFVLNGTASLNMNGYALTVGSLAASGSSTITNTGIEKTLQIGSLNTNTTYTGVISGAIAISKVGSGTVTLSGNNSFTGNVTFPTGTANSGALRLAHNNALGTSAKNVILQGSNGATQRIELTGGISISNAITLQTAGKTTNPVFLSNISGANTWNGAIQITNTGGSYSIESQSGTLILTGNVTNTINVNRTFIFTGSGNITVSGVISESTAYTVSLKKEGTGTLILSSNNTFTGQTDIDGGIIQANHNNAFGTGAVNINTGANQLVLNTGITLSNAITINTGVSPGIGNGAIQALNGGTLQGTLTINALTTNGGHLVAGTGANRLLVSGSVTSSVYISIRSGDVRFNGGGSYNSILFGNGTLSIGANNGINTSVALTVQKSWGNATFDLNGFNQTITGITEEVSANTFTITNNGATASVFTMNNTTDCAMTGVIQNGTQSVSIVKSGSGMFTLSGANTYTGSTTVSGGTLRAGNDAALGTAASGTTINTGATFDINGYSLGTEAFVLSGGSIVNNGATNIYAIQKLTVTATSTIGGSGRWDVRNNGLADAGVTINSGVTLTKQNANSVYFVNIPVVNNGTIVIDNSYLFLENNCATSGSGTYTVNSAGILGLIAWGAGVTLNNNVTVQNGGTIFSDNNTGGNSSIAGNVSISGTITISNSVTFSIAGVISGTGGITKIAAGNLTLSAANTYTGETVVIEGILRIGSNGTTGSVVSNITNNATLQFRRTNTITYAGVISGTGTIEIGGGGTTTGTVIFTGNNTCTGQTTISTGMTLQLGTNSAAGALGGAVVNNGTLIFNRNNVYTFSFVISGTGNVVKNGDGELTLTEANSYTGTTTVSSQRLNYTITANGGSNSGIGASSNSASNLIIDGGHLRYIGTGGSTDRLFTITPNGGRVYASGSGGQTWTNTGAIVMSGTGNRTLEIGGGTATTNYFAPILSNPSSGTLSVTKTGNDNVWVLTANHTYTGTTTITGGTIQLGNNTTTGSVAGNIVNNATLIFNRSNDIEYSFVISGTGTVYQSGTARLNIRGTQTYTGPTIVSSGELKLGGLGAPSATRQLAVGNIVTVQAGATLIVSGLTGSNDNNEILGGLQGDGTVTTDNAATIARLTVQNTANYTFSGQITGNERLLLIKSGTGTFTLSGNNSYNGTTTVLQGILRIASPTALGSVMGGTTVASGAAIDFNGITYQNLEPLSIAGTGVSSSGVLYNSSVTPALFPGAITVTAASTISTTNQITLSGTISAAAQNLTKTGIGTLVFTSNSVSVFNFSIAAGTLNAGSSTITIYGAFTNSGAFLPNASTVIFRGSVSQTIPGVSFYNCTIQNFDGVVLGGDIAINGILTLTEGICNTGVYIIDLGTSGTLVETPINPISYVTGTIKVTRNLLTGVPNTFGNIGVEITENNVNNNSTEVYRVTGTACMGMGNSGILRYFTINPTVDVGLQATMKFYYYDHEIVGHVESNLLIYKSIDNRVTWSARNPTMRDEATNMLTLANISSFSDWTASDGENAPLPIQLVDFDAIANENYIEIIWTTATETNNDYFTVERSTDGIHWVTIKKVAGAGNSNTLQEYFVYDYEFVSDVVYYRLKQTDYDGTTTYSKIITVEAHRPQLQIQIRYRDNQIVIDCPQELKQHIQCVELISISGAVVYKQNTFVPVIHTQGIAHGVYYVYCKHKKTYTTERVIIE